MIAYSRDLAYEYSKTILEFDLKNGQHTILHGADLRVWQKQGGEMEGSRMVYASLLRRLIECP